MSTAPTPEPSAAFTKHLWNHPGICNNCFARCKQIHELASPEWGTDNRPTEEHSRIGDGVLGHDEVVHDAYGELVTHPPRTTCDRCGSIRLLADDQSLSKTELLGCVESMADRLVEDGLEVNRRVMRKWTRIAKSVSTLDGYDREILAGAVELGLR